MPSVAEKPYRLTEAFERSKAIDNKIPGVKILGFVSESHKRRYPLEAMRAAAPLYEGARVNIDHPLPKAQSPGGVRPTASPFGRLHNVRVEENRGLVGDLVYNPHHPMAAAIAWAAENDPNSYALSHLADLLGRNENGYFVTQKIEKVHSVDVVSNGGTTTGLFESAVEGEREPMEPQLSSMTREALQLARPDLKVLSVQESIANDETVKQLRERVTALESENTKLKSDLDGHKAIDAKRTRDATRTTAIEAAKLPEHLNTEVFRKTCMEASDEGFTALLADRKTLADQTTSKIQPPASRAKGAAESAGTLAPTKDAKEFAGVLKKGAR